MKKTKAKKQGHTFERTGIKDVKLADVTPSDASMSGSHLRALDPLPGDISDPVGWADKHLEQLVPLAAKEKEWQLKFGSDAARDRVASELLAMRSLGPKKDTNVTIQPVINLIQAPSPWAKARPQLPQGVTVDAQVVDDKDKAQ